MPPVRWEHLSRYSCTSFVSITGRVTLKMLVRLCVYIVYQRIFGLFQYVTSPAARALRTAIQHISMDTNNTSEQVNV